MGSRVAVGALKPVAGHKGRGHVSSQGFRISIFLITAVAFIWPSNDLNILNLFGDFLGGQSFLTARWSLSVKESIELSLKCL